MFQRILESSNTCFLEVSGHISLTVATIIFLWIKDLKQYSQGYYSKAKTEKCSRSNLCFYDTFGMFIACSAIYFLKVIVHLLLKVATSGRFGCKKTSKISNFNAIILSKNGEV